VLAGDAGATMLHTPGPEELVSGAPVWPQFKIGRVGLTGEFGSSTINSASLNSNPAVTLLVRFVFRKKLKFICGTIASGEVGVPPVHVTM
jgi:hypothetical protein